MNDQLMTNGRNFDDLIDHFERKVHHSRKGEFRRRVIFRDIENYNKLSLKNAFDQSPLVVADVGGGLGHFSIQSAKLDHRVHYTDVSAKMTQRAYDYANTNGVASKIVWNNLSFKEFLMPFSNTFDWIFCHALIEWLDRPEELFEHIATAIKPRGVLSLCFYNPIGRDFRNLLRGNFYQLDNQASTQSKGHSLTPTNPQNWAWVQDQLLLKRFDTVSVSGIRVFSDYPTEKRGGLANEAQVIERELELSVQEPYKWLGRYLHVLATKC